MKVRKLQLLTAVVSCIAMLASPLAMATTLTEMPSDVALHNGGILLGQVVDQQGGALSNVPVAVMSGAKQVARVQTDRSGKFSVAGLTGGVYQVASVGQHGAYRLWAPQTAPPAAQQGLMMVSAKDFVLGQNCGCGVVGCGGACGCGSGVGGYGQGGPLRNAAAWMANHPIITAGAIGAAIAIPLALDDDDDPATP